MNEIDLIPAVYRKRLLFSHWLRLSAYLLGALSVLILGAFFVLRTETLKVDQELKLLQSQKAISTQQRKELEKLDARKQDLSQQLDLLAGLRSGSAAEQMFLTIDRAMSEGDVWFTNWEFRRAGSATEKDPKTVNTGYFIVIPKGEKTREETWMIETQMMIKGEAMDHAALSNFVSKLIDQPEIQSVRVVKSELFSLNGHKLVKFSLDVVVSGRVQS